MSATVIFFPPYANKLMVIELWRVGTNHGRAVRFRRFKSGNWYHVMTPMQSRDHILDLYRATNTRTT